MLSGYGRTVLDTRKVQKLIDYYNKLAYGECILGILKNYHYFFPSD